MCVYMYMWYVSVLPFIYHFMLCVHIVDNYLLFYFVNLAALQLVVLAKFLTKRNSGCEFKYAV